MSILFLLDLILIQGVYPKKYHNTHPGWDASPSQGYPLSNYAENLLIAIYTSGLREVLS